MTEGPVYQFNIDGDLDEAGQFIVVDSTGKILQIDLEAQTVTLYDVEEVETFHSVGLH